MNYPKSFKSEKYPKFIQKSIFLKAYPKPKKIFPRIGLKNYKVSLTTKEIKSISPRIKKKLKICFSSEGNKGFWDIATMSMRGVSSCMRWSNTHSKSLIGSILDQYAGVIYITNEIQTRYGDKIIARAVVRLIVDSKNKPYIFIERIYNNSGDDDDAIENIFNSFIKKRTDLPIYDGDAYCNLCHIPICEPIESI